MAAQICLKTDVGTYSFRFRRASYAKRSRINGTPAVFASRMLIGLNLTSCQIEISRSDAGNLEPVLQLARRSKFPGLRLCCVFFSHDGNERKHKHKNTEKDKF